MCAHSKDYIRLNGWGITMNKNKTCLVAKLLVLSIQASSYGYWCGCVESLSCSTIEMKHGSCKNPQEWQAF